ncbi:pseudouridine synthase [Methylobacillus gramineus]|uniref:pseudouridine synthase n=1 Tax=Methylobacillus gramineus TaxID=755169 RepID=UPI001CFF87ED|nr:pseudouridine synthase [Methylobacillus gramineus]MCB5185915.1 pseudouridine synthase [Methylobacillus gramineus]
MTTLKLKPGSTPSATKEAGKPPVRRADPSKRSRTTAPTPKIRPPEAVLPEKTQSRPAAASPTRERQARPDAARRGADGATRERTERKPGSHQPSPARSLRAQKEEQPRQFADRDTPRRGGKFRDGFEQGTFNQDRKTNPKFSPAPVSSQPEQPRLSKRMAELGLCSRREADEFIVNGWVTVDGKVVDILGTRVSPDVEIKISKEAQQHQAEIVTIVLHKPVGYVSGQAEDGYQPAVVLVHPDNQWTEDPSQKVFKRGHLHGLAPAGRLDIDSTGLLVLTQDGRVARQLIGEDSNVEKEYLVRVEGELSEDGMKKLNFGLSLDGVQLKPAKVSWQNEDQLRFVLREGRKRQIRRMCELVGLTVVGLKRVRIGSVTLGKLPVGTWRYLRHGERF